MCNLDSNDSLYTRKLLYITIMLLATITITFIVTAIATQICCGCTKFFYAWIGCAVISLVIFILFLSTLKYEWGKMMKSDSDIELTNKIQKFQAAYTTEIEMIKERLRKLEFEQPADSDKSKK